METKNTLETIYIDLIKCSEEQIEEVLRVLEQARQLVRDDIINKRFHNSFNLLTKDNHGEWHGDNAYNLGCKTELTYPDFIKLFEGGEGENNGWIKIESEADLPKGGEYWAAWKDGKVKRINFRNNLLPIYTPNGNITESQWWLNNITHYQPIIKPDPPKF